MTSRMKTSVVLIVISGQQDRIAAYASEVRRLKMEVAAAQGDEATVDLLGANEEPDVLKDLQSRLKYASLRLCQVDLLTDPFAALEPPKTFYSYFEINFDPTPLTLEHSMPKQSPTQKLKHDET